MPVIRNRYYDTPDEYIIICDRCGTKVGEDDDSFAINGEWYCAECFEEMKEDEDE